MSSDSDSDGGRSGDASDDSDGSDVEVEVEPAAGAGAAAGAGSGAGGSSAAAGGVGAGATVRMFPEVVPYKNKQRVLVFSTRGITARYRHLMEDIRRLLPHHKKDVKVRVRVTLRGRW
jgi:ribosome biogenesis protein BRX1